MSAYLGFSRQSWARGVVVLLCLGAAAIIARRHALDTPSPAGRSITITVLLDNSPSMQIGATPGDSAAMMHLTPCSAPGVMFPFGGRRFASPSFGEPAIAKNGRRVPQFFFGGMSASGQAYQAYQCGVHGAGSPASRFGGLDCPIPAARGVTGVAVMNPMRPPRCTVPAPPDIGGPPVTAIAGAPCAFACHWDRHDPPDASRDYYGLARSTIGQPPCYQKGASLDSCAITLRFDLVKNAVVSLIDSMADARSRNVTNLSLGVFTFDNDLHAAYPLPGVCGAPGDPGCAAGQEWALARGTVGTAPSLPNMPDGGIQPADGFNGGMTNMPRALKALAGRYLNEAGSGATPVAPAKALFLVTDGLDDHSDNHRRRMGALDPVLCRIYKSMGYEVYVLYTPYDPLMNGFYLANVAKFVEGDGDGTVFANLRACASDPVSHFIEADPKDALSISTGLQTFLARAMGKS